jgi:hypothetical protein
MVEGGDSLIGPDGTEGEALTPEERAQFVDTLAGEMRELFHGYTAGRISFEELTFEMFDTLQTLFAITNGQFRLEVIDEDDDRLTDDIEQLLRDELRKARGQWEHDDDRDRS